MCGYYSVIPFLAELYTCMCYRSKKLYIVEMLLIFILLGQHHWRWISASTCIVLQIGTCVCSKVGNGITLAVGSKL